MLITRPNHFAFSVSNIGNASTTIGTQVTAGSSNAQGTTTEILAASVLTTDCYFLDVHVLKGATAASATEATLQILVDPAGGTNWKELVPEFAIGRATIVVRGGLRYGFPVFIKAGSSVAAKVRGAGSGTNRQIVFKAFGDPTNPEALFYGVNAEGIGALTGSSFVSVVPGTSGTKGTWTSLGQTTSDLWWWQPSFGMNDATTTVQVSLWDFGWARSSTPNDQDVYRIFTDVLYTEPSGNEENFMGLIGGHSQVCPVPAGSYIVARGAVDIATADGDYNMRMIGIG